MPGRLAVYSDNTFKEDVKDFIKNDMIKELVSSYNIAPTLAVPTLLNNGNYLYAHFGYLPSWAKNRTSMNINARSESIYEKQTFRDSFKTRRCIIPINGFFEWKIEDKEKRPYFVKDLKADYFAVAGVWDEWFDSTLNMKIVTVALITCDANDKLSQIHHRMPVVLDKKDYKTWLYSENLAEVIKLFKIYRSEFIDIYEVTNEVNKVLFNSSSCIERVEKKESGQLTLF